MCLPNFKNYKLREFREKLVAEGKITEEDANELKERSDTLMTLTVIIVGFSLFGLGLLTGFVIGAL
jgi:hypothetical protein